MNGSVRLRRLNRLQGDYLAHVVVGRADARVGDEPPLSDASEVGFVDVVAKNVLGYAVGAVDGAGARHPHQGANSPRRDVACAAEVFVLTERDAVPVVERHYAAGVDGL